MAISSLEGRSWPSVKTCVMHRDSDRFLYVNESARGGALGHPTSRVSSSRSQRIGSLRQADDADLIVTQFVRRIAMIGKLE